METLSTLIRNYKEGNHDACMQIVERMEPLAKKYAGKIHCMEYEDALQELYIVIIETLDYLDPLLS